LHGFQEQVAITVPASTVFPGLVLDFALLRDLVMKLSKTDALLWCSRLNVLLSTKAVPAGVAQLEAAGFLLAPWERELLGGFVRQHLPARCILIYPRQLIELIRWIVMFADDLPNDGSTFNDLETKRCFVKALLLAGEFSSSREQDPYYSQPLGIDRDAALRRLLGPVRRTVEVNSSPINLHDALARGWALFHDGLAKLDTDFPGAFRDAIGLTVRDYYLAAAALLAPLEYAPSTIRTGPRPAVFVLDDYSSAPVVHSTISAFLAAFSQTAEDLKDALWKGASRSAVKSFADVPILEYGPLRRRPIIQATNGRYGFLSVRLLKESISVGPLFVRARSPGIVMGRLNSDFGACFEEYALTGLESMLPTVPGLARRLIKDVKVPTPRGEVQPFDACINDEVDVHVFEITSRFLRDDRVLPSDPNEETFAEHVRTKYLDKLEQLAHAITKYIEPNFRGMFDRCKTVYPILLVYDTQLGSPVVGEYFAKEFDALLPVPRTPSSSVTKVGRLEVERLTLMTIDDFEALESSVERFGFTELMVAYSSAAPDRTLPLHNFIAMSHFNQHIRVSERARIRVSALLEELFEAVPADVRAEIDSAS
jgi:hypothetical protein